MYLARKLPPMEYTSLYLCNHSYNETENSDNQSSDLSNPN
jgi:hypothetical protein